MKKINVLSLFGGIECGRMALNEMGIVPENYFSSEIDVFPILNWQKNFPDIIDVGDVNDLRYDHSNNRLLEEGFENVWHAKIDLLIGGSPCQSLSVAGKQAGLASTYEDYLVRKSSGITTYSDLFWEFHRILNEAKPERFMFENVRMKPEFSAIIDRAFGFSGDLIDAALLSPQHRKRVYWCGKRNADGTYSKVSIPQPEDAGMKLADIFEDIPFDAVKTNGNPWWKPVPEKYLPLIREKEKAYAITATYSGVCPRDYFEKHSRTAVILQIPRGNNTGGPHGEKVPTVSASEWQYNNKLVGQWRRSDLRVHSDQDKFPTLTANMGTGGNNVPVIMGLAHRNRGEGKAPECNFKEKANAITTVRTDSEVIAFPEYLWRSLTVRECARCQGIPDSYEFVTSDSRSYKGIGNGWEGRTVKHVLTHLLDS